jgi:D-alanyl-lipoteichoic acid acyltransferase DltB (MBOAT superfamily)
MTVGSLPFVVSILFLSSFFFLIPSLLVRQLVLASCSVLLFASNEPNFSSCLVMAVFVLSGYACAQAILRLSARVRPWIYTSYLVTLVFSFCILKHYQFLEVMLPEGFVSNKSISIVGLSYMLFRQIHFIVDVAEGQIEKVTLWEYLNYQLNLFTLFAGPIQRFQSFRESWTSLLPVYGDWHEYRMAYARFFLGAIKVCLISKLILAATSDRTFGPEYNHPYKFLSIDRPGDAIDFAVLFYGYFIFIYINFSGYCDMVIAGGGLFGLRIPENFNSPFLARNMIDYWNRWHMTLSQWIRDYVFTPLVKIGIEHWPAQARAIGSGCLFIALLLAGVWHGSTWNFVVFGVLNGLGVAITKSWEDFLIWRFGRPRFRQYLENRLIRYISGFVTLHFVCITILFFPSDLHARVEFLYNFTHPIFRWIY